MRSQLGRAFDVGSVAVKRVLSYAVVVATMVVVLAPILKVDAATNTTVVLTFDDGVATQSVVPAMLDAHGMKGTFYVNTSQIGVGGFLSWANLTAYQAAGHEIAGHTLTHPDLTTLPIDQAAAEICQDRATLASHGINASSFAYPYGTGFQVPALVSIVQGCGYNSARRANGLYSAAPECTGTGCGFPYADAIPPGDPYGVRTGDNVQTAMTLAQMQTLVTQAEGHGGGLVPIVFHHICDACDPYSTTQATLQAFLDWLQPRAADGTVVKTMAQVVGGTVKPIDSTAPTSAIKCDGAACSGWSRPTTQISLTATDNANGSGVYAIRYTTDGSTPTTASTLYSAPFTVPSTKTVKFQAWDIAAQCRGDQDASRAGRRGRSHVGDRVQRRRVWHDRVRLHRAGFAQRSRHGWLRAGGSALHARRYGPHAGEHALQRAVRSVVDPDREVPRVRQRGQRGHDELASGDHRPRRAGVDDRVQLRGVLRRLLPRTRVGDAVGNRR